MVKSVIFKVKKNNKNLLEMGLDLGKFRKKVYSSIF